MDIASLVELAASGPQIQAGDQPGANDQKAGSFSLEDFAAPEDTTSGAEDARSNDPDMAVADCRNALGILLPLCLLPASAAPEASDADLPQDRIACSPPGPDGRPVSQPQGLSAALEIWNLVDDPRAAAADGDTRQPDQRAMAAAGAEMPSQNPMGTLAPRTDPTGAPPDDTQPQPEIDLEGRRQAKAASSPSGFLRQREEHPANTAQPTIEDTHHWSPEPGGEPARHHDGPKPVATGQVAVEASVEPGRQARDSRAGPGRINPAPKTEDSVPRPAERPDAVVPVDPAASTLAPTTPSAAAPVHGPSTRSAEAVHETHVHQTMPGDIGRQMAEAVAGFPDRPVEITLSPEELGRVRMVIAASDGALTLQVVADRPDTLELMRRHADQLVQDFRDMGFDKLDFHFGGHGQGPDRNNDPPSGPAARDDGAIATGTPQQIGARPVPVSLVGRDLDIRI